MAGTPPRTVFYTQDSRETTLAEAPASFSGRTPSAYCFFTHRIPGSWLSLRRRPHFRAERPPRTVFLTHRIPGSWLSLRRWPHFRASARSESCSRCSAGLISALPLVPNRAPAAALASFLRFRSFRIVLPLQRWPNFCASGCSKTCSRCSADVFDPSKEAPNLENDHPKKTLEVITHPGTIR